MRLFLLPISTRRALIYSQRLNNVTNAQGGIVERITNRAAKTWGQWEAKDSGWQKKVTEFGNRALQRIPYEEWGLKSIPPLSARRKAEDIEGKGAIQVLFPRNVLNEEDIPTLLRRLGTERQSLHQKRIWWSIAAMPFTIPVAILPVIPNLPFFYLLFRTWSHYRALNGSKHLVYLLDNKLLEPKSSPLLEDIYAKLAKGSPPTFKLSTEPPSPTNIDSEERLLLDETSHVTIAKTLEVPELAHEVERAVKQVQKAIRSQQELVQEKKEIEKSTSPSRTENSDNPRR